MQELYDEFENRNIAVIAIAQEDGSLETHARFLKHFDGKPRFEIVADLKQTTLPKIDHTTTYYLDREGVVREVFPALVNLRPDWRAILNRIDELRAGNDNAQSAPLK